MERAFDPVTHLNEDECWARLSGEQVGRLVTSVGSVVDVTPVNFVVDGRTILFRTAAGTKLSELTINSEVLFEVDHFDAGFGWSVVARGEAHPLNREADILRAEDLPLYPFIPTLKPVFVQIVPRSLSGRSFHFGAEPKREDQQDG